MRQTRMEQLRLASGALLAGVLVLLAACGLDPAPDPTSARGRSLSPAGESLSYAQLAPDLPGCMEALSREAGVWHPRRVELMPVQESPGLSVLLVDGRQECVDATESLAFWMETGRWPDAEEERLYIEEFGPGPPEGSDPGRRQAPGMSDRGSASNTADDVSRDDSDPLPPYPDPLVQLRPGG